MSRQTGVRLTGELAEPFATEADRAALIGKRVTTSIFGANVAGTVLSAEPMSDDLGGVWVVIDVDEAPKPIESHDALLWRLDDDGNPIGDPIKLDGLRIR